MLLEKTLKKSILGRYHSNHSAILFTGGLDSTVLALIAKREKPLLVFGAVETPECASYNKASIELSKKVAQRLQLPFRTIAINIKDYLPHFALCQQLISLPKIDTDLPAASVILKTLGESGITSVFSGMGSDDIFTLPEKKLRNYLSSRSHPAILAHKKVAHHWGLRFHCPFLSPELAHIISSIPVSQRKRKQPLLSMLKEYPEIYSLLQDRPSAHSFVPENFWLPALSFIQKKHASGLNKASKE